MIATHEFVSRQSAPNNDTRGTRNKRPAKTVGKSAGFTLQKRVGTVLNKLYQLSFVSPRSFV